MNKCNTPIGEIPTKYLSQACASAGMRWDEYNKDYVLVGENKDLDTRPKSDWSILKSHTDGNGKRVYLIFPKYQAMLHLRDAVLGYLEYLFGRNSVDQDLIWDVIFGKATELTYNGATKRVNATRINDLVKQAELVAKNIRIATKQRSNSKSVFDEDF